MGDPFGVLYIVSTPIGNLEDVTLRALRVLKEVDIIAAEDTRQTQKLLNHYGIRTPMTSYHAYNQELKAQVLIHRIKEGAAVALVSDAGTPLVSDPGFHLLTRCIAEGVATIPVPGASAVLCALTVAGLPSDSFLFEGFLPRKRGKRRKVLEALKDLHHTLIFFESPYRVGSLLKDCFSVLGDRRVVLAREMTKRHEEIFRGTISEALGVVESRELKGEVTVLVEGVLRRKR